MNTLAYAVPLFSLLWIWLFWRIGVARPDLLAVGTLVIVVSNLAVTLGDRLSGWLRFLAFPAGRFSR